MGLFGLAASRVQAATLESPTIPISAGTIVEWLGGRPAHAGKTVTERNAVGIAAVWRSVNLISTTCAGLPMHAYRTADNGSRERLTTGNVPDLLAKPHPDLTPLELWELVYGALCLWGNAYMLKLRNPFGVIVELWWIAPERVKPGRALDGSKVYVLDGDESAPLSDRQMLHIPGFSLDGVSGISPIRAHREGLALSMAAEEFGAKLFGNGTLAAGMITTDATLSPEKASELKQRWKAQGTGLDSAHDIRVLGSGAKFQQLTIPPEDAQFLETRSFQIEEVARIFGLPPHLLAQTEKSTSWGTGIEQQNIGLVTYTLKGYIQRVEQRITMHTGPATQYVRVGLEGLLRGDSAQRAAYYKTRWELGTYSANDIRRLEDEPPIEGGDAYFVPMNYQPLDVALNPPPPPALPAEPEQEPAEQEEEEPAT